MKKSTIYVVGGFLVLLIIVLLIEYFPKKGKTHFLKIKSFLKEGEKEEEIEKTGPIDKIEISMGGETLTLTREKSEVWAMDKPSYAKGDTWKIRQILNLFKDGIESIFAAKVKKNELHTFGLDEEQRITLKLYEKGKLWEEFFIGNFEKEEEGYSGDSFITRPNDEYVYRIGDKNLRSPFEDGLKALRDRKVFAIDDKEVQKIALRNPLEKKHNEIIIESYEIEVEEKNEKKMERKWRFLKPEEYIVGEIDSYLRQITTLYAQEFLEKIPEGENYRIDEKSYEIELNLKDGKNIKLKLGEVQKEYSYAKVEGRDEFIKISKYTAESLMKKFGDLRDKTVFGFSKEGIQKIVLNDRKKLISLAKLKEEWKFLNPKGYYLSKTSVDSLLEDIAKLKCETYLDKEDLKGVNTGLERNPYIIEIETEGGNFSLLIGETLKDKSEHYAKRGDKTEIFTLAGYIVSRLKKSVDDLRRKEIFEFEEKDIEEIELQHPDEKVVLQRKEDKWKTIEPEENEKINQTVITTLLGTIKGLMVKEFLEGKKKEEAGLLKKDAFKLTVTLKDKSRHTLIISADKKDGDNYAMTEEIAFKGQVFTINEYQANNLMKRYKEIISE